MEINKNNEHNINTFIGMNTENLRQHDTESQYNSKY